MSAGKQPEWRNPLVPSPPSENFNDKPPPPSCPPTPPRRRVNGIVGTANIAAGYRIRGKRNPHRPTKKTSIIGTDPPEREPLFSKEDRIFFLNHKKQLLLEKRIFREKINRKVKSAMEAYEEDLSRRQELQREQQLREYIEMTRKLVEEARKEEEKRLEELAARVAEAELERERERRKLVHQKMLQRHFMNSHELRDQRFKDRADDRKRVNLVQIENNRRRQELEQKEDYDWHAMMRRYAEEGIREEKMKEAKVAEKLRQQAEVHLQQKAEKERKDSLWKSEWQNPASLDVGEIRDPEAKKLAQVQRTREDLEKQIAETRKILEERRQQEEEIDKLGTTLAVGKEMSAEDMSRDRQRRCKEFWSYMENLMEVREKIAKRQAEMDECVCSVAQRLDEGKREERRRAREKERRLNRELVEHWKRQLEQKRQREKELVEEDARGAEEEVNYWDLLKADKIQRRQRARSYGRELMEQHEITQAERVGRARSEDECVSRELAEMEREERELAEELSRACLRHQLPTSIP